MPLHGRPKDDIDDIFAGAPKTAKNETRHKKEHTEDARSHLAASKKTKTRESDQTSSLSTIGRAATGKHSASKTSAAAATFRTEDDFTDLKGVKKRKSASHIHAYPV